MTKSGITPDHVMPALAAQAARRGFRAHLMRSPTSAFGLMLAILRLTAIFAPHDPYERRVCKGFAA